MVYVILEGSLRLLVEKRHKGCRLVCSDESDPENPTSISVKTDTLPLVILEAGSVLNIDDDFFHYAAPSSSAAAVYQADAGSLTIAHDDSSLSLKSMDKFSVISDRQSGVHTESASNTMFPPSDIPVVADHLFILFEKNTKYLSIPKAALDRALRTEALELQPQIRHEVDQLGVMLKRRVRHIAPWMRGRLDVALVYLSL